MNQNFSGLGLRFSLLVKFGKYSSCDPGLAQATPSNYFSRFNSTAHKPPYILNLPSSPLKLLLCPHMVNEIIIFNWGNT